MLVFCGSCFEKGDCVINNSNLIKIKFISTKTKSDSLVTFKSIEVVGSPSIIFNTDSVAVTGMQLPVDPNRTEASFIISYYAGKNDTLNVTYTNKTIIPSSDCGAFVYQEGVSIVKNPFEGTVLKEINTQLLRNATVNFEIYF
jgi:Family of unknown function (DUF6452)